MAIQDQPIPFAWTSILPGVPSAITSWPLAWSESLAPLRAPLLRVLGSDKFALGLGGILWTVLVVVVIRSPL